MRRWRNWQTHQLEVLAPKRHRGSSPLFRTKSLASWSAGLALESSFQDEYPSLLRCNPARDRVPLSDRRRPPATGPLGRSGWRLRRPGLADRLRPARRRQSADQAHHLVGNHLHVHIDWFGSPLCALWNRFALCAFKFQIRARLRPGQVWKVEHKPLLDKEMQKRRQATRPAVSACCQLRLSSTSVLSLKQAAQNRLSF